MYNNAIEKARDNDERIFIQAQLDALKEYPAFERYDDEL